MKSMRILVSGMIAAVPWQGGATWAVLQYLLGLRDLGHDVYFVEELPRSDNGRRLADTANAAYFNSVMTAFGFGDRSILLRGSEHVGHSESRFRSLARDAELLVNLSGSLKNPDLLDPIPSRLYLDLDPCFTQLWHAVEGVDMGLEAHTHFATVGWCIGSPASALPDCGVTWFPTWQPLVLDRWRPTESLPPSRDARWTTVANWRGYGSIQHDSIHYGQKAHSLRQLVDLPRKANRQFDLALQIHPEETADIALLSAHGWRVTDPLEAVGTPGMYRRFIEASRGELGVAKSGYVRSRCGWFSDRSVCYLALGRPVLAQDTGVDELLPQGEGLFFFETTDDALTALETVEANYRLHSVRASEIAREYFDSRKVLPRLLAAAGGAA